MNMYKVGYKIFNGPRSLIMTRATDPQLDECVNAHLSSNNFRKIGSTYSIKSKTCKISQILYYFKDYILVIWALKLK